MICIWTNSYIPDDLANQEKQLLLYTKKNEQNAMALIHRIFNKTILTRDCPQILFYDFMALQIPRTLITQPEVNCYGRIMQTLAICISGIS